MTTNFTPTPGESVSAVRAALRSLRADLALHPDVETLAAEQELVAWLDANAPAHEDIL